MIFLTMLNFGVGCFGLYRMEAGIGSDATPWVTAFNFAAAAFCAWAWGMRAND
jgi:hypothetical protein